VRDLSERLFLAAGVAQRPYFFDQDGNYTG
jgi:hypothetical protein